MTDQTVKTDAPEMDPELAERLVKEILTHAGPDGMHRDEVEKAFGVVDGMRWDAAIWEMWVAGSISFGWNPEIKEIILYPVATA